VSPPPPPPSAPTPPSPPPVSDRLPSPRGQRQQQQQGRQQQQRQRAPRFQGHWKVHGPNSQVSLGSSNVCSSVAFMLTGLDPPFACQGLLFFGIRGRSFPAGGSGSHRHTSAGNVTSNPSAASEDAPPPSAAMPAGGSGSHQHTSARNVPGDSSAATAASSASVPSPPSTAAEEVPVAFGPTVQDDAGAEVAPSGPQDLPVTVEATPSGSQVPAGGPEVAASPTAVADPTSAIPSDAPSVVGMGGASSSVPPPTPEGSEVILG
jgi:hypothetical protein